MSNVYKNLPKPANQGRLVVKPLRIGHVDLDTSHPQSWIPILRDLGHEVAGVFDHGDVHPAGYAEAFAAERDIPKVYGSLEEMAEDVDLAIIHSCNWDVHIQRARPFIEAGKAVLIDKPMVSSVRDQWTLLEWEKQGHRVTGGSSLYYANEAMAFLEKPVEERGTPRFVYAGCGNDEFNYGIHAYALACTLMGSGAQSVRYMGTSGMQQQVEIEWPGGRRAVVAVGKADAYLPFYATVVTERGVHHMQVKNADLYRALLTRVLPYLSGEAPAPHSLKQLLEVEQAAVAALVSRRRHGARVFLNELALEEVGYDGGAFAAEYRLARMKTSS